MSAYLLSVVIPVYRGWEYASQLVTSLAGAPGVELVVVDDMSNDGGAEKFTSKFPEVKLVSRSTNGGFAAAVNTGVRQAEGDVLAVLNSDLQISLRDLQLLAATAKQYSPAIVGARTTTLDGRPVRTVNDLPGPFTHFVELLPSYRIVRKVLYPYAVKWRERGVDIRSCGWVNGSCLVFTRDVLRLVGYLDESYGMYVEEVDWQRRAAEVGVPRLFDSRAIARHDETHGARPGDPATAKRHYALWQSRLRYLRKFHGPEAAARLQRWFKLSLLLSIPVWRLTQKIPKCQRLAEAELLMHKRLLEIE